MADIEGLSKHDHFAVVAIPDAIIGCRELPAPAPVMRPAPASLPCSGDRSRAACDWARTVGSRRCLAYPQTSTELGRCAHQSRRGQLATGVPRFPRRTRPSSTTSMPPRRSVSCGWTPTRDRRCALGKIARASPDPTKLAGSRSSWTSTPNSSSVSSASPASRQSPSRQQPLSRLNVWGSAPRPPFPATEEADDGSCSGEIRTRPAATLRSRFV